MRIAQVTPTYLPATRYGGPIVSVHGLCSALSRRGHSVTVFTTTVDGPYDSDVPLDRPVMMDGVEVRYFRCPNLRRLYRSPGMKAALRKELGELDLVHLHAVYLWPNWMASRAAEAAAVPYVIAPRGMLNRDLIRRKSRIVKSAWIRLIERRTLARSGFVHVTSEKEKAEIESLGLPVPRFELVPNGIELDAASKAAADRAASSRDPDRVLYLGRVSWQKGLDVLLRSMAYLGSARLQLAGSDDEGYRPKLEALAAELGIASRVEFCGPVSGTEKWAMLAGSGVVVLPSISENFGNAVLEAMAVGTPVVVTDGVGLADAIRRAGAGLVSGPGHEALGACIKVLLEAPARAREMGEAGRRLVDAEFTWDSVAERMEAAYEEMLQRGSPGKAGAVDRRVSA